MKKIIRLTETDLTRLVKRIIKENEEEITKEDRIKDFLNSDEIKEHTGVSGYLSFTLCDENVWDRVKEYIMGSGGQYKSSTPSGKEVFLSRNEDITEEEFDSAYESWVDYIEDNRGYESMNQQDFNY